MMSLMTALVASSLAESTDTSSTMAAGSGSKLTVGFVDPGGTKIGDVYVEGSW